MISLKGVEHMENMSKENTLLSRFDDFWILLLMRQLLFYQGQNGRYHVFGKYLTYNSQSHADLNEVGALKIL